MAIDKAAFDKAKASASRWSDNALDCAFAVLVEGLGTKEAAAKFDLKPQRVTNIKRLFLALVKKQELEEFTKKHPSLLSFQGEVKRLRESGYANSQILQFLKKAGIEITEAELINFLG
ncbi:hypothetical protein [Iodobacter fluviatilis]|uniref:Uncharacterized protein n=1 Tax=Iodobacter fluviatilis TaxID=537 RepID=A0A7G3GEQ2_9NEIS|nr:hypothetical protein [Iodobacter fluviatilis]QBC45871.1 hypothetical protein C1H71_20220 [Iodobacter fluviatilis]